MLKDVTRVMDEGAREEGLHERLQNRKIRLFFFTYLSLFPSCMLNICI